MPHSVWTVPALGATTRVQPRQFVAGIEPGKGVVIGRRREPKTMLVILNAWLEYQDQIAVSADITSSSYGLALGKDPLTAALILPVGQIISVGDGTVAQGLHVVQQFDAHGTKWAAKEIAIDYVEAGAGSPVVRVHMDWTVAQVDWWTWFISWNNLEAPPDGNLVDGERAYA